MLPLQENTEDERNKTSFSLTAEFKGGNSQRETLIKKQPLLLERQKRPSQTLLRTDGYLIQQLLS